MRNLEEYTLYDLIYNQDLIREDYETKICWNGEDRDFCDSSQFQRLCIGINQEIENKFDLARGD